jgi:nitrite reductase/ring-hydroxylating ferredoxin subunit
VAAAERVICASADLAEAGDGVRFEVEVDGARAAAFVVRWRGAPRAYLNRCAHVPMELDWMPGKFFDFTTTLLVCSTHGATYDPATGRCVGGPCRGARLRALPVEERDGVVLLRDHP